MTATDSDTAARARALLDAYPEDVFRPPREGWKAGSVTGTAPNPDDEDGYDDVWITSEAFAAHVMRTIALPVITDLLAERDAAVARADALAAAIRGHRIRAIADQAEDDPAYIDYPEWDMDLWATVDPPPAAADRGTDR